MTDFTLILVVDDKTISTHMKYYAKLKCRKILLDISERRNKIKPKTFEYLWCGPINYWMQLGFILQHVKSEYLLINPPHHLTIKTAIVECVRFLRQHPSYVVCTGEIYQVRKHRIHRLSPKKYSSAVQLNYSSSDPFHRISAFFGYQVPLHTSVMSTLLLQRFFNTSRVSPAIRAPGYLERLFCIYAAIFGDIKVLPWIFQLKEDSAYKVEEGPQLPVDIYKREPLDTLAKVLRRRTNTDLNYCRDFLKKVLVHHFKTSIGDHPVHTVEVKPPRFGLSTYKELRDYKKIYLE